MRSRVSAPFVVVIVLMVAGSCSRSVENEWSESALASAMAKAAKENDPAAVRSALGKPWVRPNLRDLHGDGALARAQHLCLGQGDEALEVIREVLRAGGLDDLAGGNYRLWLGVDRTALELPATSRRTGLHAETEPLVSLSNNVIRVSTGVEMSLPVSSIGELTSFSSNVIAYKPAVQARPDLSGLGELGGIPEGGTRAVLGAEGATLVTEDETAQGSLAEVLGQMEAGLANPVRVEMGEGTTYDQLVAVVETMAGGPVPRPLVLVAAGCPNGLWTVVTPVIAAPSNPGFALKVDASSTNREVLEILLGLQEGGVKTVALLTRIAADPHELTAEDFPAALPGGLELTLVNDIGGRFRVDLEVP